MDELIFFSNNKNDWNYNELINNPLINPWTNKTFKSLSYDDMKFNMIIFLKEIIKYSNNLHVDLHVWINKKCFQKSKSKFYDILSITGHLFNYILTDNQPINYKQFRIWCLNNKIYYNSFKEKALEEFEGDFDNERERNRETHDLEKTNNIFLDKINKLENLEQKDHFKVILKYFEKHLRYRCALHKLC
jgi:hypothetical protein